MANNVNNGSNIVKVTVTGEGGNNNVNIINNAAQYYAELAEGYKNDAQKSAEDAANSESLAKDWANKLGSTVDGVEFSAKYYALQASESVSSAIENIQAQENLSLEVLNDRESAIVQNISTSGNVQVADIEAAGENQVTSIQTKGNEVLASLEQEGAQQVANIEQTGFYMEDGKLYYIDENGEPKEFKSGGSGLELCDIGMSLYIDETKCLRRYINGQIIGINTNTKPFLNRLKQIRTVNPNLFTTEENWQAAKTLSPNGFVYMFVIADDESTVRLPNYPDYITTLSGVGNTTTSTIPAYNAPVVGNGQPLGLIDSTSKDGAYFLGTNVADTVSYTSDLRVQNNYTSIVPPIGSSLGTNVVGNSYISNKYFGVSGNTTLSGLIANIPAKTITVNSTIQEQKIHLKYFIQIATGAETENNIVNELGLNIPFSIFQSQYTPNKLNNASWLKSEGQWNAKSVYVTVYEALVVEHNTDIEVGSKVTLPSGTEYAKQGVSVKLSTESYDDYDFVLNTTDETFRLPLLNGTEEMPSSSYEQLTLGASGTMYDVPVNSYFMLDVSVTGSGGSIWAAGLDKDGNIVWFDGRTAPAGNIQWYSPITPAGGKMQLLSNSIGTVVNFRSYKAVGNGSLYFYVGETVQNANLIDAGRLGEEIVEINAPSRGYLVKSYVNGDSWYRIYSDNWCEQGGVAPVPQLNADTTGGTTVTFLKPFINVNYSALTTLIQDGGNTWSIKVHMIVKNTTNMVVSFATRDTISSADGKFQWKAEGYISTPITADDLIAQKLDAINGEVI